MAFLSLDIALGIVNFSGMKDFWSTYPILSQPWLPSIKLIMSRDRFLQILYYLHVNDNQNTIRKEKLFILRPLLDHIVRHCNKHYHPKHEVSNEEQMTGTKCRVGFHQYLPMKPTKRGIKVWVMADAVAWYCGNLQVYTGKEGNDVEKGLASRVVKEIMEDYQGQDHQLFC